MLDRRALEPVVEVLTLVQIVLLTVNLHSFQLEMC